MEKYSTAGQATDGNIILRMRIVFCITKAINAYLLCFHGKNGNANAPQCYAVSTLSVLSFVGTLFCPKTPHFDSVFYEGYYMIVFREKILHILN